MSLRILWILWTEYGNKLIWHVDHIMMIKWLHWKFYKENNSIPSLLYQLCNGTLNNAQSFSNVMCLLFLCTNNLLLSAWVLHQSFNHKFPFLMNLQMCLVMVFQVQEAVCRNVKCLGKFLLVSLKYVFRIK